MTVEIKFKSTFPFFSFVFTDSFEFKVISLTEQRRFVFTPRIALELSEFLINSVYKHFKTRKTVYELVMIRLEKTINKLLNEAEKIEEINAEDEEEAMDIVKEIVEKAQKELGSLETTIEVHEFDIKQLEELMFKLDEVMKALEKVKGFV